MRRRDKEKEEAAEHPAAKQGDRAAPRARLNQKRHVSRGRSPLMNDDQQAGDDEAGNEEEDDVDMDEDIAALEAMEAEASTPVRARSPQGRAQVRQGRAQVRQEAQSEGVRWMRSLNVI
jgi:hypothetical protein